MSRPTHYDVHRPLPARSINDSNAQTIDLGNAANFPVCVTAGGSASLTNGTPGPITYITWNPVGNPIFDRWNFVGQTAPTQNLRIPVDGFYDLWYMVAMTARTSGSFSLRSTLEGAQASDSGYASPTFNTLQFGPSQYFHGSLLVPNGHLRWEVLYRNFELHANDLVRIGLNMYNDPAGGTVADQVGTVVASEFKFTYAIPNDAIIFGGP